MRETVNIVIVGHVDHGKSTLIGRLLLDTKSLPSDKILEIKKASRDLGKENELAYVADQLKEEREKNITIDTTQIFFRTRKRDYVIIDAPGHVEFIRNMITGASLAESAVLIVDAVEGVREQTRRHAYLLKMLGLGNIIVVINKMDITGYEEGMFDQVKEELAGLLAGLDLDAVSFIPVSAKHGDNISRRSGKMRWYRERSFLEVLDRIKIAARSVEKPLRFPVQDIYEEHGERIIAGRMTSGTMRVGQDVLVLPEKKRAVVKRIMEFGRDLSFASEGKSIGLVLDGQGSAKRGDIIADEDRLPLITKQFKGKIFWMEKEPLKIGLPLILRCATQEIACVAEKIENRIDTSTLEVLETNANELGQNETAVVTFRSDRPMVIEDFSFIEELGRFVIERELRTEGAGTVTEG